MGFNSAFKGLISLQMICYTSKQLNVKVFCIYDTKEDKAICCNVS